MITFISRNENEILQDFLNVLANGTSSFESYHFETPPIQNSTAENTDFEFILKKSPTIHKKKADKYQLSDYFSYELKAVKFPTSDNDATIVSPVPDLVQKPEKDQEYAHLSAFMRSQNSDKIKELWKLVGTDVLEKLSIDDKQFWISTGDENIAWTNIRISEDPKIYIYDPYKEA